MGIFMQIISSVSTETAEKVSPARTSRDDMHAPLPYILCGAGNARVPKMFDINVSPKDYKKRCREIRSAHGVSWFKNIKFCILDTLFGNQSIISKIESKYDLNPSKGVDAYKEAAQKYFMSMLGDTTGLTDAEKAKRYEKLEQEFALQITHMSEDDKFINEVMAAVIGELESDKRAVAAQELISVGRSGQDINAKARALQKNAVANLTKADAFGNTPEQEVALEYQNVTFANMDEMGVKEAIVDLEKIASDLDIEECKRLQALKAMGVQLTPEQEETVTLYENCVLAGYTGGYTGIASNQFISEPFAVSCMANIYSDTEHYNITDEVMALTESYMSAHPELEQNIQSLRGESFSEIIEKAAYEYQMNLTSGTISEPKALNESETVSSAATQNNESNQVVISEINDKSVTEFSSNNNLTMSEQTTTTPKELSGNSTESISDETDIEDKGFSKGNYVIKAKVIKNLANKSEDKKTETQNITLEEAVQSGITKFKKYQEANHISAIKACTLVLNNHTANASLKKQKRTEFKAMEVSDKELVFNSLKTSAQIYALNVMKSSEIARMEFSSSYSKEFADKLCEEKKEQEA